jgi:hypothetical protein
MSFTFLCVAFRARCLPDVTKKCQAGRLQTPEERKPVENAINDLKK